MNRRNLAKHEFEFVQSAASYLESPSLALRLTDLVGMPIGFGVDHLPAGAQKAIETATRAAVSNALNLSIATVILPRDARTFEPFRSQVRSSTWTARLHTAGAGLSGAAGGFFGLAALPLELPLSMAIILRSVSSVADDFWHDLRCPRVRLECIAVLAIGSGVDCDYFSSRLATAQLIEQSAKWIASRSTAEIAQTVANKSAPALIQFVAHVAARFEVVVSQKALAHALPVVGAITGAAINAAFADHFATAARFHFGIRALEFRYGSDLVRAVYDEALQSKSTKKN